MTPFIHDWALVGNVINDDKNLQYLISKLEHNFDVFSIADFLSVAPVWTWIWRTNVIFIFSVGSHSYA